MQYEINSSDLFLRVHDLISALRPLKSRPDRQLNMAKFGTCYNLSNEQTQSLIDLVLQVQSFFLDDSERFHIQAHWKNGTTYLSVVNERRPDNNNRVKKVTLSSNHAKILLDLTFIYQHIKNGRGFNSKLVNSELCQKAKELYMQHPYLVAQNGNGILHPTLLGVQLGAQLRIYKKLNRNVTIISIDDYKIQVGDENSDG